MEMIIDDILATEDELRFIYTLRASVRGSYVVALSPEQKVASNELMKSLRGHGQFSNTVH